MSPESDVDMVFLPAKLSRPRLDGIYPRKRMFEIIDEGRNYPLIWVSGPAGSGKTTVVNSYLKDRDVDCLWYTIDESDSDIASFFYYLRKWASYSFSAEADLPPLITPDYFPNIPLFAKRFFEKLYALIPSSLALVFDNYQEVEEESPLHLVMDSAISQNPGHIKVYILSREEPPAELARRRANRQLYLMGWRHLRLELSETRGIAHTVTGIEATDEIFADLQAKTDGWVAGLLLLLKRGEYEGIQPQLLSRHTPQEIFDYLGDELFEKQSPRIQQNLLRLAFLSGISLHAAKSVCVDQDAETLLETLFHGNAFLSRIMGENISYRFHPLMQAFLKMKARQTLESDKLKDLQAQSAAVLSQEGPVEEAVQLYIDVGDLPAAIEMILIQAPELVGSGRFRTLETMITSLPESIRENEPWCMYWRCICKLPFYREGAESGQSEEIKNLFVKTFNRFEMANDQIGTYLSLAGILESIFMATNSFKDLDPWIEKYEELRSRWGPDNPPEVMNWLTPPLIYALMFRRPNHPLLREFIEKGMEILQNEPDAAIAVWIFLFLTYLNLLQGNLVEAKRLIDLFKWCADKDAPPIGFSTFNTAFSFYSWLSGSFHDCMHISDSATPMVKQNFVHSTLKYLYFHGGIGALNIGNLTFAENMLLKSEQFSNTFGPWDKGFYRAVVIWIALIKKEYHHLKHYALEGLDAAEKSGCLLMMPLHYLQCSLVCHITGEHAPAKKYLKKAFESSREYHTRQVEFGCHLARAEFALAEGNQDQLTRALKDAFQIGRENDYVVTWFWRQDVMAELCMQALEKNIEVDYVHSLIRRRKLIPATPPRKLVRWPWQIKVYTFGGFALEIDGKPVTFTGKAQFRPLSVLKYLIANGGQGISDILFQDNLWPDSDGDRAAKALKSALHRLRKMLGDNQSILMNARKLSLNVQLCWTDAWAFGDLYEEAKSLLKENKTDAQNQIPKILNHLLDLYKGPFLPDDEAHWAVHAREHLSSRFVGLIKRLTQILADTGDVNSAINILKKALNAEPMEKSLKSVSGRLQIKTIGK